MNLSDTEKQDLRHAIMYVYANRPGVALPPAAALPSLKRLLPFAASISIEDVNAACLFHTSLENLKCVTDVWGGEDSYEITAKGTLAYERDRNKIG
jgi:hypothetical protein